MNGGERREEENKPRKTRKSLKKFSYCILKILFVKDLSQVEELVISTIINFYRQMFFLLFLFLLERVASRGVFRTIGRSLRVRFQEITHLPAKAGLLSRGDFLCVLRVLCGNIFRVNLCKFVVSKKG